MSKKNLNIHHAQVVPMPVAESKTAGDAKRRDDSWSNLVTGIGTSQDKRLANRVLWDARTPEFFEQAYGGSAIMARIVDLIPVEALRKWVDWAGVEKNIQEEVKDRCELLGIRDTILRTWIWGRAFGGGCLHIVTDTRDPSQALQRGEKVLGLRDLSRWDLRVLTTDIEYDFASPNFGHPNLYYLNLQMGSAFKGYPIHWTRMVRFDGQLVPRRTFIRNNYWHDSVLNRPYNAVRNYESSNDAAALTLQDFNVDVYKMKNLANLVGSGNEDVVKKRIELIQYAKSVIRAMMLDADDEDYENKGRSLEGVSDLLRQQANRLVADTDIPHTKLLGESPEGSNATGNSTSQQWYDFIASEQENYLRPKLKRLVEVLFPEYYPALNFKFKPLRTLDDTEQAEIRNKQSITDKNYIDSGVLDPTEIAESRFGGEEYSLETKLDQEGRASGLIAPHMASMDPSLLQPEAGPGLSDLNPEHPDEETKPEVENEQTSLKHKDESVSPAIKKQGDEVRLPTEVTRAGTQFEFKNQEITPPRSVPKTKAMISQTMSEPMRDPSLPPMKGPGIPNQPRTLLPTRGNGVIAPSGYDFAKDAGSKGAPQEGSRMDSRAATILVKKSDSFLMGKRRDTGRWTMPGGVVEKGESMHQGGLRELKEETGLQANRLKFLGSRLTEPTQGQKVQVTMYQHESKDSDPDNKYDPDQEISEWQWVPLAGPLPEEIANNLQHPNNVLLTHLGLL